MDKKFERGTAWFFMIGLVATAAGSGYHGISFIQHGIIGVLSFALAMYLVSKISNFKKFAFISIIILYLQPMITDSFDYSAFIGYMFPIFFFFLCIFFRSYNIFKWEIQKRYSEIRKTIFPLKKTIEALILLKDIELLKEEHFPLLLCRERLELITDRFMATNHHLENSLELYRLYEETLYNSILHDDGFLQDGFVNREGMPLTRLTIENSDLRKFHYQFLNLCVKKNYYTEEEKQQILTNLADEIKHFL